MDGFRLVITQPMKMLTGSFLVGGFAAFLFFVKLRNLWVSLIKHFENVSLQECVMILYLTINIKNSYITNYYVKPCLDQLVVNSLLFRLHTTKLS